MQIDPKLDLVLERSVDVSPDLVWMAWTEPEHLVKWFTPAPWTTAECEIDLRPGGAFRTVMRSPDGEQIPNSGCYLEIVTERRLVWTNTLLAGFRPKSLESQLMFRFTAAIHIEPDGRGTKYTAHVMHGDEAQKQKHEEMGFHGGWGTALEQLVAHVKTVRR